MIFLDDPYYMLGMCCIIHFLENIESFVQFAQQEDIFICDLIVVVKICQG
jgi:hypothetical protein